MMQDDIEEEIAKLEEIEFHDLAVESIQFRNEPELSLIVNCQFPSAFEPSGYSVKSFAFKKIVELKCLDFQLFADSDIQLYSFDYSYGELFNGHFMFLLGFGQQNLEISFSCEEVEVLNITKL